MIRRAAFRLIATAIAGTALPRAARAQTLTTVRVGASLDDGLTPVLYALHAGIFKKVGLDVQLQSSTSGAALAAAVAGGGVDIAKSSLMALISGYTRGVRFKLVAGAAMYTGQNPTDELSVLKESTITRPADVNGKTVVVNALKSLDQLGILATVDRDGGDSATIKFIELPFSAMLGALEQGRAEMAAIGVPVLAAAKATGKIRTLGDPYDGIGKRFLIAGWFCNDAYAARNVATVQRFGQALVEATTYTNAHHAETVPILAAYSGIDPDVIRKMNRLTNAVILDPKEIQPSIDAAAKYKFIDAGFSARELLVG